MEKLIKVRNLYSESSVCKFIMLSKASNKRVTQKVKIQKLKLNYFKIFSFSLTTTALERFLL